MKHLKYNFIKSKNKQKSRFHCWYFQLNSSNIILSEENNIIIFSIGRVRRLKSYNFIKIYFIIHSLHFNILNDTRFKQVY